MLNSDTVKTYASGYYDQKVRQRSIFHDLTLINARYSTSGTTSIPESPPFVVEWQMPESENNDKFEPPPAQ